MKHNDSVEDRQRIMARIGPLVLKFVAVNKQFRMKELLHYVERHTGGFVAPDSPGRCLRALRQKGRVDYIVVDKKNSLFRMIESKSNSEMMQTEMNFK